MKHKSKERISASRPSCQIESALTKSRPFVPVESLSCGLLQPISGVPIGGVEVAGATGALVFHAGTALRHGELVSAGGRVLNLVGTGESLSEAREQAYAAVEQIDFPGAQFRTDIAAKAVHVPT